jgi:glyoxylase-like metal-dependent hydrolase (beta-lactamase superfamily II)
MEQTGQTTRRHLLKTAIGGTAGLILAAPVLGLAAAQAPAGDALLQPLADDLFLIRIPGEANIVAHATADGVLLVDGGSRSAEPLLTRALAGLPGGGRVHTLFNTHWHPEQTGSNERLGGTGTTIIAQENTRLWLTTDVTWPWNGRRFTRLPKAAQPNKSFYTTAALDRVPGVRYGHIPDAAHTDGDLYVYFEKPNVLVVGDVATGDGWPVIDWVTGGWIGGIVGGLQRIGTLAAEGARIVPARGGVLGVADIKAQFDMYSTIYDRLTQLLNKGRSPGEAVAARPTKEFDERMGNPDEFVHRAFESLWAYLSPDA